MGIAADFVLIVAAGLIGGVLARALRLPLLVGYVAAGVAVGPYTGGPTVVQVHDVELLAEIGVALLLFSLGLEIAFRDLLPVKRIALIGGPIQILLTLALGAAAGVYALRMAPGEAVWFGAMLAVSSTMVVLKTISAAGFTSTLASRVMIGLLVMQDLAVIPMLVILPNLGSMDGVGMKLARSLGLAAGLLVVVYLLGSRLLPRLLRLLLERGSHELFLVAVVATGVGAGYGAHAAGFSFALGAFIAGLVLSESEFSHQALSDITPLRDIFGLLFFVTVGMLFDPRYALAHAGQVMVAVCAIFAGKALLVGLITRAFGYTNMAPWIVGLGLSQIGEFSFVLVRAGLGGGFLSKPVYDLTLTCTVLTMALSPLVASLALPLGRWWRAWRKPKPPARMVELPSAALSNHIIVAGSGKTGRPVIRALQAAGVPMVVVEMNYATYADLAASGCPAILGDITSEEMLHAARVEQARVMLITMPDASTVEIAMQRARRLNANLQIVVRASGESMVDHLRRGGAVAAIQPEFEGGIEMVRQALASYQHDAAQAQCIVDRLRAELYEGTA